MAFKVDPHSGEPLWRQLVEAVKYEVASGALQNGHQLPSIRALAGELKINPRTVVKAYEELEHAGLVVMQQGRGVFIRAQGESAPASTRRKVLGEMVKRLLAEASRLGANADEVRNIVNEVATEMEKTHV